jgi:tetratricopeptide (TPR) repeat protein
MLRRTPLALSLMLALGLPMTNANAAPAKRNDARAHFDAAAELYAREDYAGAASEFAIAYALDPQVDTLFAWAQAERLAGHFEQAAELYERLLLGDLSDKQREAVQTLRFQVLGELELANAGAAGEPDAASELDPSAGSSENSDDVSSDRPVGRDRVGVSLVGVGVGLTTLGGGLLLGGALSDQRVRAATTYPEFEAAYDPQTGRGRGAVPLYVSGGVLAVAGLVAAIIGGVRMARAKQARTVALTPMWGRTQLGMVLTIGSWR